jgi:hypothetical protein
MSQFGDDRFENIENDRQLCYTEHEQSKGQYLRYLARAIGRFH